MDTEAEHSPDVPERLHASSPSVKLVYKVLEYEGPLTQKQLGEETRLPARTIRHALNNLTDLGIVTEEVYFPDARQRLYRLTGQASS